MPNRPLALAGLPRAFRRGLARVALAAVAQTIVAGSGSADAAQPITIYSALDVVGTAAEAFTAKTGIPVKLVQLSTGEVLGKVAAEGRNPQFDLLWVEGSAVMARLAADGILKPEPDLADGVQLDATAQQLIPIDHAFYPTGFSTTAIAVNTKQVAADRMPKSWADLEAYAGKVAAKDPNLSGPAFQWLAGFFQTDGEEQGKAILEKTLTDKAISGLPSGGAVNRVLIAGDADVAIQQDSSVYSLEAKGEPVTVVYPSDGVVALPASIGVSATTANEAEARQFIRFLLTEAGTRAMQADDSSDSYFAPAVAGVPAKGGRKAPPKWILLDDRTAAAHEAAWKSWFRDQFVP